MTNARAFGVCIAVTVSVAAGFGLGLELRTEVTAETVTVYAGATCGCCEEWARRVEEATNLDIDIRYDGLATVRQQFGVPSSLRACHTSTVAGYLIEGHVPASAILRLLRERPDIIGLVVPGMPIGSPGMGDDSDFSKQPYEVLAIAVDGSTRVFSTHQVEGEG